MCGPPSRCFSCAWIALAYSLSIPTTRRCVCLSDQSVGPVPRMIFAAVCAWSATSESDASPLWYCSLQSCIAVMFVRAASMNCWSAEEHVWTRFGRARPLVARTRARAVMARRPAAMRPRRRTDGFSAFAALRSSPKWALFLDKDEAAIRDRVAHADVLVDADRRRVLGADEQADRRHALQEQAAEVAHSPLGVTKASHARVDPDLLELHGRRRPGGRLGLEADRAVLQPDPRAPVIDLHARSPAEALRVALERVDAELLAMRLGARRHEQLEVVGHCCPQSGLAGRRRLVEHVHRLARPVLARRPQPRARHLPEVAYRALLADHEPGPRGSVELSEHTAADARRDEVGADVAEGDQPAAFRQGREPAEPAARHVLEEDALDRVLGAVGQDLVQRRFAQRGH